MNISDHISSESLGYDMIITDHISVLTTFVSATGQVNAWKFPKFHVMNHVPRSILMFGSLEVRVCISATE
jgi:hypothetical protein